MCVNPTVEAHDASLPSALLNPFYAPQGARYNSLPAASIPQPSVETGRVGRVRVMVVAPHRRPPAWPSRSLASPGQGAGRNDVTAQGLLSPVPVLGAKRRWTPIFCKETNYGPRHTLTVFPCILGNYAHTIVRGTLTMRGHCALCLMIGPAP